MLTLLLVLIGWVFFFSPDFATAFTYLSAMFGGGSRAFIDPTVKYYLASSWKLLAIGLLGCGPWVKELYARYVYPQRGLQIVFSAALLAALVLLCVPYMMNATYQSFLYAQF